MKKKSLYIETSVFGFYYDEKPQNVYKRESTVKLFEQIKEGRFRGFISPLCLEEILATEDEDTQRNLRSLTEGLNILSIGEEKRKEIESLSNLYIQKRAIPPYKRDDAIHIATVVVTPEIDILVSWNCKHIVNVNTKIYIKGITEQEGYRFTFEIATPEEVIL